MPLRFRLLPAVLLLLALFPAASLADICTGDSTDTCVPCTQRGSHGADCGWCIPRSTCLLGSSSGSSDGTCKPPDWVSIYSNCPGYTPPPTPAPTPPAETYGINFTDMSETHLVENITQCGPEIKAVTNVTCGPTTGYPNNDCTWTATVLFPSGDSAVLSPAACPLIDRTSPQLYTRGGTRQYTILKGCVGAPPGFGQPPLISAKNTTGSNAARNIRVIPSDPTSIIVSSRLFPDTTRSPQFVYEGEAMGYSIQLGTKIDIGDGNGCVEKPYSSIMRDKPPLTDSPYLPYLPDLAPVVRFNQTVKFRNWPQIYKDIKNDVIKSDADVLSDTYAYYRNFTTEQCTSLQPYPCPHKYACLCKAEYRNFIDENNRAPLFKDGIATFSLTAYRDAELIEDNFIVGYNDAQGKFTPYQGFPIGAQGMTYIVKSNRPVTSFSVESNDSTPYESDDKNFQLRTGMIDKDGNPTNQSPSCYTPPAGVDKITLDISSEEAKNFAVSIIPECSKIDSGDNWWTLECPFKPSFLPTKIDIGISKPGLYKVIVTDLKLGKGERVDKYFKPGAACKMKFGTANIQILGMPRDVSVESPPDWFEHVPFDVNLSIRDGAGKIVPKSYEITLTVVDKGPSGMYTTTAVPSNYKCTTSPLTGRCKITLKAEALIGSGNGLLDFTGKYTGDTIYINGKAITITDGHNQTIIWEAQCADFAVNPPKGPTEIKEEVVKKGGMSNLVNDANAKNYEIAPKLIGLDSAGKMSGNKDVCYDQPQKRAQLCVNDTSGMFVSGAGIFCIKEFTYTPLVDGLISDHLNYTGPLDRKSLLDSFRHPQLLWGWGFIGPTGSNDTCYEPDGTRRTSGKGYNITFSPGGPTFPGTGDYFNVYANSVRGVSLPPYNITTTPKNPHEISGVDRLLVLDDTGGGSLRMFKSDGGSPLESYPLSLDDRQLLNPQSMIADRRGNIFVTDTIHRRIVIFKIATDTPGIKMVGLVPETLELKRPQGISTSAVDYRPMGVAIDTNNRLFIAGFTTPGQTDNYLIIQVYGSDLKTVVAEYYEPSSATVADISVDPQGMLIYLADGGKRVRQFAYNPDLMSCTRPDKTVVQTHICETPGSQVKDDPFEGPGKYGYHLPGKYGYHLFVPCRHISSGCWAATCGLYTYGDTTMMPGGNSYFDKTRARDFCSVKAMEEGLGDYNRYPSTDACLAYGEDSAVCHDFTTARSPGHDSPEADHSAMAVFYKKGYVFAIDKFVFQRQESWRDCDDHLCACLNGQSWGGGYCDDCADWGISCNGCGKTYSGYTANNGCKTQTTYTRTEYWLRVFREDQAQGNILVPVFHGAFKQDIYDGPGGSTVALWAGQTRRPAGSPTDEVDKYGWDYTAGKGSAQKLGITPTLKDDLGETTGLFVDDDFNVYLTVSKPNEDAVYKVKMELTPTMGVASSVAQIPVYTTPLNNPRDVLAYPDLIKQTLTQGVWCEGCSDKGLMELDVCKREEEAQTKTKGAGLPAGGGAVTIIPLPPKVFEIFLNSSIDGRVHTEFQVSIENMTCPDALTGSAHSATVKGSTDARSNSLQATVEGGLFKIAFSRPYRPLRDPKGPHTLPILEYEAYSARLLAKHFVVMSNIRESNPLSWGDMICADSQGEAISLCTAMRGTIALCQQNEAECGLKQAEVKNKWSCPCRSSINPSSISRSCGNDKDAAEEACRKSAGTPLDGCKEDSGRCGTYVVTSDARFWCSCHHTKKGMVNSSYRFNYTLMNNSFFNYAYILTNVDVYESVASENPGPRYDIDAQQYLPHYGWAFPNYPAGYENVSLNWSFPPQYVFVPERFVKNPLPLNMVGDEHKLRVCSELAPTAPDGYGKHLVGDPDCAGEITQVYCDSICPLGRSCSLLGCEAAVKEAACDPAQTGCTACYYEVKPQVGNPTNSPVIVQLFGHDSNNLPVSETFTNGYFGGKGCGAVDWKAGDSGNDYDWRNVTKVVISAPTDGDTIVGICPPQPEGCDTYSIKFNESTGIPGSDPVHHKLAFGYVPQGTSLSISYPPEEILAPADKMSGWKGYALMIEPLNVSATSSITIDGYTGKAGTRIAKKRPAYDGRIRLSFGIGNPSTTRRMNSQVVYSGLGLDGRNLEVSTDPVTIQAQEYYWYADNIYFSRLDRIKIISDGTDVGLEFELLVDGGTIPPVCVENSPYLKQNQNHPKYGNNCYYALPVGGEVIDNGTESIGETPGTLQPVNGLANIGGAVELKPFYDGTIELRALVMNYAPETANITVAYAGLDASGKEWSTSRSIILPGGAGRPIYTSDRYSRLDRITVTSNSSRGVVHLQPLRDINPPNGFWRSVCVETAPYYHPPPDPSQQCYYEILTSGMIDGGSKWTPDMKNVTVSLMAANASIPKSGPFTYISEVRGTGGYFGDRYYVWQDPEVILPIATLTGNSLKEADPLARPDGTLWISAYHRACCNIIQPAPFDAVGSCSECKPGGTNCVSASDPTIPNEVITACTNGNYYNITKMESTVNIIGRDAATGRLVSESKSLKGKENDALVEVSSTRYSAIYRVTVTGGVNETVQIWTGALPILKTDVKADPNYAFRRIEGFEPEDRLIRVRSTEPASNAVITVDGSDGSGAAKRLEIRMAGNTGDSTEAVVEVYSINITGAKPGEKFDITTAPLLSGVTPKLFGTIYVSPYSFNVFIYQDLEGIYRFTARDSVQFKIMDEDALGYHGGKYIFYDRFNNTFIRDQPFNFTLPTKLVLQVFASRNKTDANRTHVNLTATLLYSTLAEQGKPPSHPLFDCSDPSGTPPECWIEFYENRVTDTTKKFVMEQNNPLKPDEICTCPFVPTADTNDDPKLGAITCPIPYGTCTKDDDCNPGSTGLACIQGRCLQSFGFMEKAFTNSSGMTSIEYQVCGWGKHRAIALFQGTRKYAPSLDIQVYYSGGLPLDIGSLAIWIPVALILLLILYKLYSDARRARSAA